VIIGWLLGVDFIELVLEHGYFFSFLLQRVGGVHLGAAHSIAEFLDGQATVVVRFLLLLGFNGEVLDLGKLDLVGLLRHQ